MRNCQICGHGGKRVIFNDYDDVAMCLFACTDCGHRYIDGLNIDQAYFDDYYLTKYSTDDKPYSDGRLNSLADMVSVDAKHVLDIGGMDGELVTRLKLRGVDAVAMGVTDIDSKGFDRVILSHTLEHIYDIGAMFQRIADYITRGGLLFVEVPIHEGYMEPKQYDYHWQHINKFRPQDLEKLLTDNGYFVAYSKRIEDYREYQVWRIVGKYAGR